MNKEPLSKRFILRRIKDEFPALPFARFKFIDYGDDHVVVVLDRKIIFRFPRTSLYRRSFVHELRLVEVLKTRCSLPVPNYIYVAKKKTFGGYRLIRGVELTEKRFHYLSSSTTRRFVGDIADFLTVMHSTNKKILPAYRAAEPWSGDDLQSYNRRYWKERRRVISSFVSDDELLLIDSFYDSFIEACAQYSWRTIIHGDLSGDHMLFDNKRQCLAGIIDFADAAIGDPAQDFSFFGIMEMR